MSAVAAVGLPQPSTKRSSCCAKVSPRKKGFSKGPNLWPGCKEFGVDPEVTCKKHLWCFCESINPVPFSPVLHIILSMLWRSSGTAKSCAFRSQAGFLVLRAVSKEVKPETSHGNAGCWVYALEAVAMKEVPVVRHLRKCPGGCDMLDECGHSHYVFFL